MLDATFYRFRVLSFEGHGHSEAQKTLRFRMIANIGSDVPHTATLIQILASLGLLFVVPCRVMVPTWFQSCSQISSKLFQNASKWISTLCFKCRPIYPKMFPEWSQKCLRNCVDMANMCIQNVVISQPDCLNLLKTGYTIAQHVFQTC